MLKNKQNTWLDHETKDQIVFTDVHFGDLVNGKILPDIIDEINVMLEQGYYDIPELIEEYKKEHGYDWAPEIAYSVDYYKVFYSDDEKVVKDYYGTVIFKNKQALKGFLDSLCNVGNTDRFFEQI